MDSVARATLLSLLVVIQAGLVVSNCTPITLPTGTYFTDAPVTLAPNETIAVACNLGYVATNGSSNGSCNSTSWSWGTSGMLQCTKGCLAPILTRGVEYVSDTANTSYLSGTSVSLRCSTNYSSVNGSANGTCNGTTFTWSWSSGKQLECDPVCPNITLSTGVEYASGSSSEYTLGDVVSVRCSSGYVATGGGLSATCLTNNTWLWNGTKSLQCSRGCLAPSLTRGVEYVSGNANTSYLNGTVVSLKCSANYTSIIGSANGTCNATTFAWSWAAGRQLECDPVCPNITLTTGIEFVSGNSSKYTLGDVISLRCSRGYAANGGSISATCLFNHTWQWNGTGSLRCSKGCLAPNLTQGVEYVSGDATTAYLNGSIISLKCGTNYGYKNGSYIGTCNNAVMWKWNSGKQLECQPACPAPILSNGTELTSNQLSVYTPNSTITLRCGSGYVPTGGGASATCLANSTWLWNGTNMLKCLPACLPPVAGLKATILRTALKDIYIVNDTVQFECVSGYVPWNGSLTGVCTSNSQWTWEAGATTSLSCVISPPYKDRGSDTFKESTCKNYVMRLAPTPSTCLISCLHDGYCRGHVFDGGACYLDRPYIEATASDSRNCFARP